MFYLKTFNRLIWQYPVKGILFLTLTISLMVFAIFSNYIEKQISTFLPEVKNNHYFFTLIAEKENYNRVSRKLRNLPGIKKVTVMSRDKIDAQVKIIFKSLNMDVNRNLFALDYAGLKIVFVKDLQLRSQLLIRDYLTRLVGKNNLIISPIKKPIKSHYPLKFKTWLTKWGKFILPLILCSAWLIVSISLLNSMRKTFYIIEKFQRKKHVAFKTIFSGLISIYLVGLCITAATTKNFTLYFVLIGALFVAISSLGFNKTSWKVQT